MKVVKENCGVIVAKNTKMRCYACEQPLKDSFEEYLALAYTQVLGRKVWYWTQKVEEAKIFHRKDYYHFMRKDYYYKGIPWRWIGRYFRNKSNEIWSLKKLSNVILDQ